MPCNAIFQSVDNLINKLITNYKNFWNWQRQTNLSNQKNLYSNTRITSKKISRIRFINWYNAKRNAEKTTINITPLNQHHFKERVVAKMAKIIIIISNSEKDLMEVFSYRPTNLLPIILKLMERILLNKVHNDIPSDS